MNRVRSLLEVFIDSTCEIESLEDYYRRTNETLLNYKRDVEKKHSPGKKIADLFDGLFAIDDCDQRNERISIINEEIIENDIKLKDIYEITPFDNNNLNTISFSINSPLGKLDKYDPKKAKVKYEQVEKYAYILCESVLSHIIISFETFLSNIYRLLLTTEPERYLEGQMIPLSALFNKRRNETIIEYLDAEVTSKMYDSFSTINLISEKEKISFDNYKDILDSFKEIYYRRNAYVHTKGKVNKNYLLKINNSNIKKKKIGDDLNCDEKYLKNAMCILNQMVFSMVFELLKKEKASENAINIISYYYFEKLCAGEYTISKYAYYNLSKYTNLPFLDRIMYRINYLIASKQLNEIDLVKQELKELDVSAAENRFKIAKECLNDNFETVYDMLNKTYPNSFKALEIKEWPIFIDFRKTKYYSEFVKTHESDFAIHFIDDNQSEIDELMSREISSDKT